MTKEDIEEWVASENYDALRRNFQSPGPHGLAAYTIHLLIDQINLVAVDNYWFGYDTGYENGRDDGYEAGVLAANADY